MKLAIAKGALFYSPVDFTDASDLHQSVQVWCIGEINRWIKQRTQKIARQLLTYYVVGIYRPNYPVTLKSKLRVTQTHWKRNHWIDHTDLVVVELFDVEYYRDLEMWVRGHS